MVEITVLKLQLQEGSLSANLPFSGVSSADGEEDEDEPVDDESAGGGKKKVLAIVGVFVFLVIAAALVKHLSGDDDHEVAIETPDEPVGVTVDDES